MLDGRPPVTPPPAGLRLASALRDLARRSGMRGVARRVGISRLTERAVLRRYASKPNSRVDLDVGGFRLTVPGPSLEMYLFDRYEPMTIEWIRSHVHEGWHAVDAGASIGYLSLHLSRLVGPRGRVIACEPVRETAELLAENLRANGADNVTVVCSAVGSGAGRRTIQLTGAGYLDGFYGNPRADTIEARDVEITTIDALADPPIDFVKIDVEGAELDVLDGMRTTLSAVRALVVEWNPACLETAGAEPRELPRRIIDAGFDVQVVDEVAGKMRSVSEVLADLDSARLDPLWYGNLVATRSPARSVGE
jgi:FkbM family methyltransferase